MMSSNSDCLRDILKRFGAAVAPGMEVFPVSSRWFPLAAVFCMATAAVLVLSFIGDDSQSPMVVDETGPSPLQGESNQAAEVAEAPGPDAAAHAARLPNRPQEPPSAEPAVGKDPGRAADRRLSDPDVRRLAARLAELEERVASLEASLARVQDENESLKAENEELKAERDRLAGIQKPFDPAKLPKRKEFEATGEVVDDLAVLKPTRDGYWPSLRLETWLHPEIRRYRIKWFSGKWSPWYTPGVDDLDSKTNDDGTQRRIWSYFHDHQFQVDR